MTIRKVVAVACVALGVVSSSSAVPFVPADDRDVLETLPEQRDPALATLKRLQRASRAAPHDLALATRYARGAIQAARATGDPRFLGQAQSALGPWWTSVDVPAPALLLRATIKQSLHDFEGSLRDLDRLLAVSPRDGQARLTRATVRTVLGRYADAIADCNALEGLATPLVIDVCRADIAGRSGRAEEAYALVVRSLETARVDTAVRAWAATLAAEIAARRGDGRAAERHFRAAIAADPQDAYALGAYADWLIDAKRFAEVATLLDGSTRNDTLLLRRVLALRELPDREAYERSRGELAARLDAARRRGDALHRREEARFALFVERDAKSAVKLARENWNVQCEPADLRILAESARAAGDAAAMRIVADWVETTRFEDVRVAALLRGGA